MYYKFMIQLANSTINSSKKQYKIKMVTTKLSSHEMHQYWEKMLPDHLLFVLENYDFLIIIDETQETFNPKNTILIVTNLKSKFWLDNLHVPFYQIIKSDIIFDWKLSLSYSDLLTTQFTKTHQLSTHISNYMDTGSIKKYEFTRYLINENVGIDVYGKDVYMEKNFVGLVHNTTDDIFKKYKYALVTEDTTTPFNMSHKLVDAILSECLVFYHGCDNIRDIFKNDRHIIYLHLSNFEQDKNKICDTIIKDEYYKRLPFILEAKKQLLYELQLFNRFELEK